MSSGVRRDDKLLRTLEKTQEIELTVTGRRTGRAIPRTVWVVVKGNSPLFIPVNGPSTHWYKNILKQPKVEVSVGGLTHEAVMLPITDKERVLEIVRLFTAKYGKENMERYYPDKSVAAELTFA